MMTPEILTEILERLMDSLEDDKERAEVRNWVARSYCPQCGWYRVDSKDGQCATCKPITCKRCADPEAFIPHTCILR